MIISKTPYRISFFGGGTDYPVWYREHGGAVLATTIDKYCYITTRYLPPFFEHKTRVSYSQIELVKSISEIQHPSVRETLSFMNITDGVEIHTDGDLPARTGLGSSSTFTVGLLNTLYALKGMMPSKLQLAAEAIHIEQNLIKENVGSQDQAMAAFGGFNRIDFAQHGNINVRPIMMNVSKLEDLQNHLMLFYTGVSRSASQIAAEQIRLTSSRQNELREMYNMVGIAVNILTHGNTLQDFGSLLHEAWQLKRSLTNKITTSNIDDIYEIAKKAGATGGKLLGAGGGGFMLFYVEPELQDQVREKLGKLLHVPIRFENFGSQIIYYNNNYQQKQPILQVPDMKEQIM